MNDTKYVVMTHLDYKEDSHRIIFIQYNQNEESLIKLANVINNNPQTFASRSLIDINNFVTEQTVNEMCNINTYDGYYPNPLKLTGIMKPIIFNFTDNRMD